MRARAAAGSRGAAGGAEEAPVEEESAVSTGGLPLLGVRWCWPSRESAKSSAAQRSSMRGESSGRARIVVLPITFAVSAFVTHTANLDFLHCPRPVLYIALLVVVEQLTTETVLTPTRRQITMVYSPSCQIGIPRKHQANPTFPRRASSFHLP